MIEQATFTFRRDTFRILIDEREDKFAYTIYTQYIHALDRKSSGFLYASDQAAMLAAVKEIISHGVADG